MVLMLNLRVRVLKGSSCSSQMRRSRGKVVVLEVILIVSRCCRRGMVFLSVVSLMVRHSPLVISAVIGRKGM